MKHRSKVWTRWVGMKVEMQTNENLNENSNSNLRRQTTNNLVEIKS
jgi:hypothetical protein